MVSEVVMCKKVSFAPEVKSHDGVNFSMRSIVFYQIVGGYFKNKFMDFKLLPITCPEDILYAVSFDSEYLTYTVKRLKYFRKLLFLKGMEVKSAPVISEDKTRDDPYWDNDFFKAKVKKSGHKVSIVRKGCRDFNMCFEYHHIANFNHLIGICEKALEENTNCFKEWYIIEDYFEEPRFLEHLLC